jgi:hypothetical protein
MADETRSVLPGATITVTLRREDRGAQVQECRERETEGAAETDSVARHRRPFWTSEFRRRKDGAGLLKSSRQVNDRLPFLLPP